MFALQVAMMKGRGGVLTSLFHYARMWDSVGVRSVCLYRGPAAEPLRDAGIAVIDAPPILTSPLSVLAPGLRRLRQEICTAGGGEPDVIMAHSDRTMRALRRMFPAAVMMTRCHSDKTKHKRDADVVVTLNSDQHERVARSLAGSRPSVLMLGNPFTLDPPPVTGDGPLRINYVARFVAEKDPLTFAKAVARLSRRPLPVVRLIGEGPLEDETRRALVAAGIEAEFPGWRSQPFEDFTANDILVLPSTWEGLPWLLLEAQARGVPVVASDIAGNRLALGDGAYGDIYAAGNPQALAACLDAALADLGPLRGKVERGRAELPNRFGPHAFWNSLQAAMKNARCDQRQM